MKMEQMCCLQIPETRITLKEDTASSHIAEKNISYLRMKCDGYA